MSLEVCERREKGESEDDDSKFPPPPEPVDGREEEVDSILAALSRVMGIRKKFSCNMSVTYIFRFPIFTVLHKTAKLKTGIFLEIFNE